MNHLLLLAAAVLAAVLGLFAFRAHAATSASPQLPANLAGQRVAAFLDAFNTGDEGALRRLLTTQYDPKALAATPIETRLRTLAQLREDTGKLALVAVHPIDERQLEIVVRGARRGARLQITFQFAPGEEHLLLGARVLHIEDDAEAPAADLAGGPLSVEAARQAIAADLAKLVKDDRFSGAVKVTYRGATLFEQAYGLADRERKRPNTLDTRFNVGSINKVFTKVAIAQLAESGRLSLGETVAHYLPDYPDPEIAGKVTVEELAAHTSGMGDIFTDRFPSLRLGLTSLDAYLKLFVHKPLEFTPGARQSYSNAGFVVLGLIVERLTGGDYYAYVRQHVYAPAGMADSDSYPLAEDTPNRAIGYTFGDEDHPRRGPRRPDADLLPARGSSAGGGYSTVGDLTRFAQALAANRLVGPAWTSWVAGGPPPNAAPPGPIPPIDLGVAGGTPGVNAVLELDPVEGIVAVLSNYDPPSAMQVSRRIRTLLGRIKP